MVERIINKLTKGAKSKLDAYAETNKFLKSKMKILKENDSFYQIARVYFNEELLSNRKITKQKNKCDKIIQNVIKANEKYYEAKINARKSRDKPQNYQVVVEVKYKSVWNRNEWKYKENPHYFDGENSTFNI